VKRLKNDRKNLEILTPGEVLKMFPSDYTTVWGDKEVVFAANRLASLTGMRIGEVLGLKGEYVYDDHILVCGQSNRYGYKKSTKTKKDRTIPLLPEMIGLLRKLMVKNGSGFVFSEDGGVSPLTRDTVAYGFSGALRTIGINDAERNRRGLSLHGWRHFLNTSLLTQGMTIEQVQGVTGHLSKQTTELYNHIDARQMTDVLKAQEAIYGKTKKEPPPENNTAPALTLVKPENEDSQKQKTA
jgi:integrase